MTLLKSNENITNLILLDEDPIFTLGLKEFIKQDSYADINILATGKIKDIYSLIQEYQTNLWVIGLDFDRFNHQAQEFINSLSEFRKEYPHLSLVIIVNPQELIPELVQAFKLQGCCYKYDDIHELIKTFRICAQGEKYVKYSPQIPPQKKINQWFYRQCNQGLKNISQQIDELSQYTSNSNLSVLDLIYWQGRKRELTLTKWLIKKTLPRNKLNLLQYSSVQSNSNINTPEDLEPEKLEDQQIVIAEKFTNNYEFTRHKFKKSLRNLTGKVQEIDILTLDSKKQLFHIILDEWYNFIEILKQDNYSASELARQNESQNFIQNLYYQIVNGFLTQIINQDDLSEVLSSNILSEETQPSNYTFEKLYFIDDLIMYQVIHQDLCIDNKYYPYGDDQAEELEIIILDNFIIAMANYVMRYILNYFYDNLDIKDKLFQPQLKSSRKVAMFRNNLAWQYRQDKYWENPTNIFEDKYEMLKLTYEGIKMVKINHSRHAELNQIQGIPWLVTMLIELRDSLSRGVKSLGDTLGKVLVYLLTEVIGKAIGLIGKGILQGIGSKIKN